MNAINRPYISEMRRYDLINDILSKHQWILKRKNIQFQYKIIYYKMEDFLLISFFFFFFF